PSDPATRAAPPGVGKGRGHPQPGARPPLRGRRAVSRAAGRRELPPAADRDRRDRKPDRRLPPGLQPPGADLQQRGPDRPGCLRRRPIRLRHARLLRRRRRGATGDSAGELHARPPRRLNAVRGLAVVAGAVAAAFVFAASADARSYTLVDSYVTADVAPSGAVGVQENITVAFSGAYTFGFRDIPVREGESIDGISVLENNRSYAPGA